MKITEAYLVMQKESGIKEGDKVRILRSAKAGEMGWNENGDIWESTITKQLGGICTVSANENCLAGLELHSIDGGYFRCPFFVLEKIQLKVKEMTVKEISEQLGYEIKIIK